MLELVVTIGEPWHLNWSTWVLIVVQLVVWWKRYSEVPWEGMKSTSNRPGASPSESQVKQPAGRELTCHRAQRLCDAAIGLVLVLADAVARGNTS